eukprot:ctg_1139.g385
MLQCSEEERSALRQASRRSLFRRSADVPDVSLGNEFVRFLLRDTEPVHHAEAETAEQLPQSALEPQHSDDFWREGVPATRAQTPHTGGSPRHLLTGARRHGKHLGRAGVDCGHARVRGTETGVGVFQPADGGRQPAGGEPGARGPAIETGAGGAAAVAGRLGTGAGGETGDDVRGAECYDGHTGHAGAVLCGRGGGHRRQHHEYRGDHRGRGTATECPPVAAGRAGVSGGHRPGRSVAGRGTATGERGGEGGARGDRLVGLGAGVCGVGSGVRPYRCGRQRAYRRRREP